MSEVQETQQATKDAGATESTDAAAPSQINSSPDTADSLAEGDAAGARTFFQRMDGWMSSNPWHPRVMPEMLYLVLMSLALLVRDYFPTLYPAAYAIQCGATVAMLWRYRRLLPELTLSFHWIALPIGALVFVVWMLLGIWLAARFPDRFDSEGWNYFTHLGPIGGWIMLVLKFAGMCLVVPVFEELFNRSLLLRSFSHFRRTGIGIVNLAQDMPVLEDVLLENKWAKKAVRHRHVFADMFIETPLGQLTITGVLLSSFIFMLAHGTRDWPAAFFCGLMYCVVVWWTNPRKENRRNLGLGPVIWAHAITNAMIWVYTLHTGDWRFM